MKLYILAAVVAIFCFAYWSGVRMGRAQCRVNASSAAINTQNQIIKTQREIDAQVYNSDTGDIRRVLREKYTIAQ